MQFISFSTNVDVIIVSMHACKCRKQKEYSFVIHDHRVEAYRIAGNLHLHSLCVHCACLSLCVQVVELLLAKGANFEHRNVSDYTPLSLAASGGYVNIIKLLLRAGADINSRSAFNFRTFSQ